MLLENEYFVISGRGKTRRAYVRETPEAALQVAIRVCLQRDMPVRIRQAWDPVGRHYGYVDREGQPRDELLGKGESVQVHIQILQVLDETVLLRASVTEKNQAMWVGDAVRFRVGDNATLDMDDLVTLIRKPKEKANG